MRRLIFAIPSLLCLSACATEGTLTAVAGATGPVAAANVWSISVIGTEPDRAEEIRNCVLERLVGSSLAQHVVLAGTPADRVLEIQVTRLRYVSPVARAFGGAIAGRNVVIATETLRDPRTPGTQPLKVFTVDAESAAHPLSFATMFEDALKQFADKTMEGLQGDTAAKTADQSGDKQGAGPA